MRRLVIAGMAALMLALPAAAAAAGCAAPRTTLADVEDEVMCPVCGVPLALATEAPQARDQREFITGLVEDCRSKEEIKDALVAQYGERVLALPRDDGFELAAYLVPLAALALAAGGIGLALARRRREPAPAASPAAPAPSASDAERLDADMRRYEL